MKFINVYLDDIISSNFESKYDETTDYVTIFLKIKWITKDAPSLDSFIL